MTLRPIQYCSTKPRPKCFNEDWRFLPEATGDKRSQWLTAVATDNRCAQLLAVASGLAGNNCWQQKLTPRMSSTETTGTVAEWKDKVKRRMENDHKN